MTAGWRQVTGTGDTHSVCMLALVSSKAQSRVDGSRPDTRRHSMDTFRLRDRPEGTRW